MESREGGEGGGGEGGRRRRGVEGGGGEYVPNHEDVQTTRSTCYPT